MDHDGATRTTPERVVWSDWIPLQNAIGGDCVPRVAGLYRIRKRTDDHLVYVGQTGKGQMHLRRRIGMLRGVYRDEMPYRDPHTAGPALWALHQIGGTELMVSFAEVHGDTPWRKGLECVVITEHRRRFGVSPTANFGRMPRGFRMSSANNSKLVAAGKRFRGGPSTEPDTSHLPGGPPVGLFDGPPTADGWCGHAWSPWSPAEDIDCGPAEGLYRLRGASSDTLAYVGEGVVQKRVWARLRRSRSPSHPQGSVLADLVPLQVSWTSGRWEKHQRLELENDLIAAHVLVTGVLPAAQFLG